MLEATIAAPLILQIVIAVLVEPTDRYLLPGSLQLSTDRTVIGTAVCLNGKTAVLPQRPLGAEAVRRLQDTQQHGGSDRTERRNLAKPFPHLKFLTLRQQISPHFLAQRSQCIQLLIVILGPPAHSRFADLPFYNALIRWKDLTGIMDE